MNVYKYVSKWMNDLIKKAGDFSIPDELFNSISSTIHDFVFFGCDVSEKEIDKAIYLSLYERYSATDKYCVLTVDTTFHTVKYRIYSMADLFNAFTTTTTSAGEITARLLVSKDLKKDLITNGYIIGSEYEYNALLSSGLNRGQALECMMSSYFQCEYKRDSVPFYISGDINCFGIEYQVKSHKATFSNLKALKNLLANEVYKNRHDI